MQDDVNYIVEWSDDNNTRINGKKTTEMIISFKKKPLHFPPLKFRRVTIERVVSSKLLGIYVSSDLKWRPHIRYLYSKTNKRLYFLTCLKSAGVEENDLVEYYIRKIRSVIEYACPVWSTSLTQSHLSNLEQIQKHAMHTLFIQTLVTQMP